MQVSSASNLSGIVGSKTNNEDVDEQMFLQLLTAQLQYQDPLNPTSDTEFVSQLAVFSQLEQQRLTNENLKVISLYEQSINNTSALQVVGKEVKLQDNSLKHTEGQSHEFYYDSDSSASRVTIEIVGDKGQVMYSTTQVGAADGEQQFTWNGLDDKGEPVRDGNYRVRVLLEDAAGEQFPTSVYQRKLVEGVSFQNGSVYLMMDGESLPIENVVEVYGANLDSSSSSEPEERADPGGFFKNGTYYPPIANYSRYPNLNVIPGGK
jgi:flagellar basal-body rod modification protein FlgD